MSDQYKAYAKLLDNERAVFVRKALGYLDGDQEQWMVQLLSTYGVGRTNWQTRGIIPRYRNLTKMIVEKSGMLFINNPPKVELYTDDTLLTFDEQASTEYLKVLNNAGWLDTMINLDQVVRLTKTGLLLINYDAETDNLVFDILHRGNCEVIINENNREVQMVVYITGEYNNYRSFRIITKEQYIDFEVDTSGQVKSAVEADNPYGIVPVVPFYDTQKPRMGFWVEASKDLISMNEMYNIHLTDSEFAAKWEKYPTLFTNLTPAGQQRNVETWDTGHDGPTVRTMLFGNGGTMPAGNVGGPDRMIQMDGQGVDNPFIEYKAPNVDLASLDAVFNQWVKDFAYDWSVRVKTAGEGSATSGFQLVVEEIDNLQLRKLRQRMFEAGLVKMFEVIRVVWNATHGAVFSPTAKCVVEFSSPMLPTDVKMEEEVWSLRIREGRASIIDYFVESKGYSREDAENKVREIQAYQNINRTVMQPEPPEAETPDEETDGEDETEDGSGMPDDEQQ